MSIAGAGAAAVMPPLELEASGAYRFGSARGTWKVVEGAVVLSGHYAAWGPGRLRGGALCFSFKRGPWPVGVELRRPWDRRQPGGEDAGIASAVRPGPAGPR